MADHSKIQKRRQHSLIYEWAIIAAAVTLIAFVLVAGSWTWKLDGTLYDTGIVVAERPARADVVIVAIDEDSMAAQGGWPWRRAAIAQLIERIAEAKPKAVGVDILFTEPDYRHPEDDQLLAAALARTANVVLPILSVRGLQLMPARSIAGDARLGRIGLTADNDGILRRVALEPDPSDERMPHMALVMAQAAGVRLQQSYGGEYLIPFAGPSGKIRRISASSILRGDIPSSMLESKFVLLGVTTPGIADSYAIPARADTLGSRMTSVEVTANILSGLLDGRHIRQLDKHYVGLISAAAILILLIIFYRVGPTVSVALMFAATTLTPLFALMLLSYADIWFPPVSVALSALIAYPLWSWKRLEAICHNLDEEIVQMEKEHDSGPGVLRSGTVGFADYIQNRVEIIRLNVNYLRAARKFLTESLDGLPNAALVVAPDGHVVVANRHALELCRLDKTQSSGWPIEEALVRIKLEDTNWLRAISDVLAGEVLNLKATDASGSEFEIAIAPFSNDRHVISGLIVVIEDVTKLRQAEREREEALSFLSHDIRSPQNSIMALSQLQRTNDKKKSEDEFVSQVETLARKTVTLAEDFLQLVRADSKPLSLSEYDLAALVEDCVADVEPQARAKQITIDFIPPSLDTAVEVDRTLLSRAIGNLLGNAIKYAPQGGRISVTCGISDSEVQCSISDNGPGIDKQDLPLLFKRFGRGKNVDHKASGAGLGLAFVDVVAKRHGGKATAQSTPGQGATFSITLPMAA